MLGLLLLACTKPEPVDSTPPADSDPVEDIDPRVTTCVEGVVRDFDNKGLPDAPVRVFHAPTCELLTETTTLGGGGFCIDVPLGELEIQVMYADRCAWWQSWFASPTEEASCDTGEGCIDAGVFYECDGEEISCSL